MCGTAARAYASYYSDMPKPVVEGVEITSLSDIVYIDVDAWESSILKGGVPVVVGDRASLGCFRRFGLISRSEASFEVHKRFLTKSGLFIKKMNYASKNGIDVLYERFESTIKRNDDVCLGAPVLFSTLSDETLFDKRMIREYSELVPDESLIQEEVDCKNILVHLDSLVADEESAKNFLLEVVETIPAKYREYLFEALKKSIL
jgi:hypothetical protein